MQRLILPINKVKLTASIDTDAYYKRFGFRHYGSDMVTTNGSTIVYAGGKGTVVATGYDNACGNVVAVVYPSCYNHKTGQVLDVTLRYYHLASISVKMNQAVTKDTKLGHYGRTGRYSGTGAHLHLEADKDTLFPLYTSTVTASNYLRGTAQGAYPYQSDRNTLFNALEVLHVKPSLWDLQTYTTANDAYIRPEDKDLPRY